MVEVFTTTIKDKTQALNTLNILQANFPNLKINFDLDDALVFTNCKNGILRVEGILIDAQSIISIVNKTGFFCEILEDKVCTKRVNGEKISE